MSLVSEFKEQPAKSEAPIGGKYVWTPKSEEKLIELHVLQQGNWKSISGLLDGPNPLECMYKWQQLHPDQPPSRQLWSPEEDQQLKELVQRYGKKWSKICTVMNWRTGKQVRERYLNQLQGTINQEKWSEEEDKLIIKLYKKFGTKWSYISSFLTGRPENMVKNRFYANLRRRYQCDIGDSDDEDNENSQDSSSQLKSRKKIKKRPFRSVREGIRHKKIPEVNSENFERITRSKIPKQSEENSHKQETPHDDQNMENFSGLHNQTCPPSLENLKIQIPIKEENQQEQSQKEKIFPFQQTLNQQYTANPLNPSFFEMQQLQFMQYQLSVLPLLMNPSTQFASPIQPSGQMMPMWSQFYQQYNRQLLQNHMQSMDL